VAATTTSLAAWGGPVDPLLAGFSFSSIRLAKLEPGALRADALALFEALPVLFSQQWNHDLTKINTMRRRFWDLASSLQTDMNA
jgi:hypothetical protein